MSPPDPPNGPPSLAEHVVLGLVAEGSSHGFALARLLAPGGPVGQIYTQARPAVYRTLDRLVGAGMIEALEAQRGERGPERTPLRLTGTGSQALQLWLARPVPHVRDLRTEFLVKLALLDRRGSDPGPLVRAQTERVADIVEALAAQERNAQGFEKTLGLWRLRSAQAALEFLHDLA